MSDYFGDTNNDTYVEPTVEMTPNIELQLNKFNEGEYLKEKYIPEKALFANKTIINSLKSFYINNIDMSIIVYGNKGIGKITCILGLLDHIPCYLPDNDNDNNNDNDNDNNNDNDNDNDNNNDNDNDNNNDTNNTQPHKKLNNILFFKVLDNEYSKLLYYENIYYLNMTVLHNNTDIMNYLKYIYKLTRTRNFDENEKKIIIISNIDKCNNESQKYISFMIEKISNQIAYIFTSQTLTLLDKKITSACANIKFNHLNETEFCKIFLNNFKHTFNKINKAYLYPSNLKRYYQIYVSNKYNIGTSLAQIKYYLETEGISFLKDKNKTCSLMSYIAKNFIKKKLILSTVNSALEIRKFIYLLVSLNIKLILFVQEVVKQLLHNNLNATIKLEIIKQANLLSHDIVNSNKEVILLETFFYNIINIIYSSNILEKKST